ncbi:hypothetical protein [Streptomyces sp. NPDC052496]|uniref:hypothetical protein n=1 Tax=Streptomyces sp. NPDC052496 TaxID=3154951 RepID=UPI0034445948
MSQAPAPPESTSDQMAPSPVRPRSRLHIGWIMPPFVHELPVDAPDADAAAERLHALATELMPEHSAEDQYRFALGIGAQLEAMIEADVIYAGLCFLDVDERPSASTIMVSQVEHDSTDDEELLRVTRELLERKHPDDEYRTVELPCGPALTRIGSMAFLINGEWSPTGQELPVQQSQIQVYIPLPGTRDMLVFSLDCPSPEAWELHSELFAEILKTVDWGTDQEIEDYRAMRQSAPVAAAEPDAAVQQELFWHSSRLLDAVALRARMVGGEQTTSVTCEACWSKGLRSACSARHGWRLEDVPPADLASALSRIDSAFSSQGWQVEPADHGAGLRARAGEAAAERSSGYSFTLTADAASGTFSVEVSSACERISVASDSLFG